MDSLCNLVSFYDCHLELKGDVLCNILKFTWVHSEFSNKSVEVMLNLLTLILSETQYF